MLQVTGEVAVAVAAGAVAVLVMAPSAFSPTGVAATVALLTIVGPLLFKGVAHSFDFLSSLSTSRKHGKIDGYNSQYGEQSSAEDRSADYANLVNSYYDLATEFYEWGWGTSFHFANKMAGESFRQSIMRHEYYLAGRLDVKPGDVVLDCGCGIGGPARNIARFTGTQIKAVTINQFQVNRGNVISAKEDISDQVKLEQADFMKLPYPDASFDAVYAIESTCHAPDRIGVYGEILRVLKPGGKFACYEWCLTDSFETENKQHQSIKHDIEVGDGLPDIVHTSVCTKALKDVGFEVLQARDAMIIEKGAAIEGWYVPLTPSWNPFKWPQFQFNPVMFRVMPALLSFFELIRVVPEGTKKTQVMLQAGGVGCAAGGTLGIFTPGWLMEGRKPL